MERGRGGVGEGGGLWAMRGTQHPWFSFQERQSGDALAYNNVIQYETLRTAVCEFVERPQCPKELV